MERITLREAAQRTARSITTLRRYIRSGRLRAEKRFGRFGPEYYLSVDDLDQAGLEVDSAARPALQVVAESAAPAAIAPAGPPAGGVGVPISLYQELQMKHEQLLVQYGMIRAAGVRSLDVQNQLDRAQAELDRLNSIRSQDERAKSLHGEQVEQQLRTAHFELEGRALQIAALKEKVRGLEMLTRNSVTNETIEKQFDAVMDQSRRVQRMRSPARWPTPDKRPVDGPDDS
jgi:hypothetical protein